MGVSQTHEPWRLTVPPHVEHSQVTWGQVTDYLRLQWTPRATAGSDGDRLEVQDVAIVRLSHGGPRAGDT